MQQNAELGKTSCFFIRLLPAAVHVRGPNLTTFP